MHFPLPEKFETPVVMATLQSDCHKIRTSGLYSKLESSNYGIIKVEKDLFRSSILAIYLMLLSLSLNHVPKPSSSLHHVP